MATALPTDVIRYIFQLLEVDTARAAGCISSQWAKVARQSDAPFAREFMKSYCAGETLSSAEARQCAFHSSPSTSAMPFKTLLKKLQTKHFLLATNSAWSKSVLQNFAAQLKTTYGFQNVDCLLLDRSEKVERAGVREQFAKYDGILISTNYGWTQGDANAIIGDLLKEKLDDGCGFVLCVFVGCSWKESPTGEWRTSECQPIVPNVEKNNVQGSQTSGQWDTLIKHHPDHFLLSGVPPLKVGCASLGKPHGDGVVVASIKGTVDDPELPFLVTLQKGNSRIISVNSQEGDLPLRLIANMLLYTAKE